MSFFITETILVACYTVILHLCLSVVFKSSSLPYIFVLGFLKHFLGYYLLKYSKLYCQYGESCKNILDEDEEYYVNDNDNLVYECILEGFLFIILFILLGTIFKNTILIVFLIPTILHICAEYLGIHSRYCQLHCVKKTSNVK
jgi:hypothetical protein